MNYTGWRAQESRQLRITKGLHATEGWGVYLALDRSLAESFSSGGTGYLLTVQFTLDRPLVVREPCYILHESDLLEEPIQDSDSVWLKSNKYAFQQATSDPGASWSQAQETMGFFVTEYLRNQGYDGVIIDQGAPDRWAVVFDPRRVTILSAGAGTERPGSRQVRLARILVEGESPLVMKRSPGVG